MEKHSMVENDSNNAHAIVSHLLSNDLFSQWMNIEIIETREGFCKISCPVKKEMTNGFQVTHGGIIFSLADSALAFAASTYGRVSLAIDHSITFTKKSVTGDSLIAAAECIHLTHKIGNLDVTITNKKDDLIAVMKGTVYRTGEKINI